MAIHQNSALELNEIPVAEICQPGSRSISVAAKASWLFRFGTFIQSSWALALGMVSLVGLLAIVSSIPVLNLLSFGYLMEVVKRTGERRSFKQVLVGIDKARFVGGILIGSWLLLLPIRYLSHVAHEAYLVDPGGEIANRLYLLRLVVTVLVVAHIAAALICGGKLRYFFWPLIAPFSLAAWIVRRMAGWKYFRKTIEFFTNWICSGLANDICKVAPITDWFLPAIFFRKMGQGDLISNSLFSFQQFIKELHLLYYFKFGVLGFIGSFIWLSVPTLLLAGATLNEENAISVSAGVFGTLFAIPVFTLLPLLQAQFAVGGRLRNFFEIRSAINTFRRAPIWHLISWIMIVLLSLPLYLLKIESVPSELLWLLTIVFLIFTLPSKFMMGWAYARAQKREAANRWWLTLPVGGLLLLVSVAYVLVLTTTRYLSWNGAFSLFENHVFLLPSPFWL